MSYPGWLWSYGINYTQREADIVVIGPDEIANQHANSDYFNARFQVLLRTQNYTIYRVPAA